MKIFKVLIITLLVIVSSLQILLVSTTTFNINTNEKGLWYVFSWRKFPKPMNHNSKIIYKHDYKYCECMALLTEDIMKEDMVYMYVKKVGDWMYEFEHHYENGKIVRYTHDWE